MAHRASPRRRRNESDCHGWSDGARRPVLETRQPENRRERVAASGAVRETFNVNLRPLVLLVGPSILLSVVLLGRLGIGLPSSSAANTIEADRVFEQTNPPSKTAVLTKSSPAVPLPILTLSSGPQPMPSPRMIERRDPVTGEELVTAPSVRHDGLERTAFDAPRAHKAIDRSDPYGDPSKTLPQLEPRQPSIDRDDRDVPQSHSSSPSSSSIAEVKTSRSRPGT